MTTRMEAIAIRVEAIALRLCFLSILVSTGNDCPQATRDTKASGQPRPACPAVNTRTLEMMEDKMFT